MSFMYRHRVSARDCRQQIDRRNSDFIKHCRKHRLRHSKVVLKTLLVIEKPPLERGIHLIFVREKRDENRRRGLPGLKCGVPDLLRSGRYSVVQPSSQDGWKFAPSV